MKRRQMNDWRGALLVVSALVWAGCGDSAPHECVPTSCEAEGRVCGSLADGCGETLQCGTCDGDNDHCDPTVGQCVCDLLECGGECCAAGQVCAGGQCAEPSWLGVTVVAAHAPDETTVVAQLSGDPGRLNAEIAARYSLDSPLGSLVVQAVSYDVTALEVTLTTSKQKLGVTYTLSVDRSPEEPDPSTADFLSADTATFWVTDFDDPMFAQYQVVADRAGVGSRSVAYLEQGWTVFDTAAALAEFDTQVYPTLTSAYLEPPDMDGNERIVILGVDGGNHFGGYFSPTNAYTDEQTMAWWGYHSNEMELVHVNANMGMWAVREVVTHEFGHLLHQESHGMQDWDYHDEGFAEVGVHLVYGVNLQAVDVYFWDPSGLISTGLSLVHWTWAQYENYAQAYLFWIYVLSRAGGAAVATQLFNQTDGSPAQVDTWLQQNVGSDFASVQRDWMLANWIKAPTGPYGYDGLLDVSGQPDPPTVPAGTTSLDLPPFTGAYFRLGTASVDYPGTEGADMVYRGINGSGTVDATAPFDVSGGALVVFNSDQNSGSAPTQHSGPDAPAVLPPPPPAPRAVPLAWTNPPPVSPARLEALRAWRRRARQRLVRMGK